MTDTFDAGATEAPAQETVTADTTLAAAEGAAPAAEAAAQEQTSSIDETMRATWDRLNPRRDEDGRFAAKDGEQAKPETVPADQSAEMKDEPAAPAIDPPISWSAEHKAKWESVPLDLRQYIAQRDKEAQTAISRYGQHLKAYEPLGQVIDHFKDTFQRNGIAPADGIARLLAVESRLASDPAEAIKDIAKAYGVELSALITETAADGAPQQQGTLPPEVSALKAELAQTKAELGKITSHLTAQERSRLQAENAALTKQIADFANGKPHFDNVRHLMGAMMMTDETLSLEDAYERALYADPNTRQRILSDQRKADEEKQAQEARKRATDAKKAASVNVRSTSVAGGNPKTMDDTLRETARRLYGHL